MEFIYLVFTMSVDLRVQMLDRKNKVPRWSEIFFNKEWPIGIAVGIHKDIADGLRDPWIVELFVRGFGAKSFPEINDPGLCFGLNGAGVKKVEGDLIKVIFPLPREKLGCERPCPGCKGEVNCPDCGDRSVLDVAGSLSALSMYADMVSSPVKTSADFNQLIVWTVVASDEPERSNSIGGTLSAEFCDYLRYLWKDPRKKQKVTDEAVEAMKSVYAYCHRTGTEGKKFCIRIEENGALIIRCPDGPSEILSDGTESSGTGCEFDCRDIKTPVEIFVLLACLAVLCKWAREDAGHY